MQALSNLRRPFQPSSVATASNLARASLYSEDQMSAWARECELSRSLLANQKDIDRLHGNGRHAGRSMEKCVTKREGIARELETLIYTPQQQSLQNGKCWHNPAHRARSGALFSHAEMRKSCNPLKPKSYAELIYEAAIGGRLRTGRSSDGTIDPPDFNNRASLVNNGQLRSDDPSLVHWRKVVVQSIAFKKWAFDTEDTCADPLQASQIASQRTSHLGNIATNARKINLLVPQPASGDPATDAESEAIIADLASVAPYMPDDHPATVDTLMDFVTHMNPNHLRYFEWHGVHLYNHFNEKLSGSVPSSTAEATTEEVRKLCNAYCSKYGASHIPAVNLGEPTTPVSKEATEAMETILETVDRLQPSSRIPRSLAESNAAGMKEYVTYVGRVRPDEDISRSSIITGAEGHPNFPNLSSFMFNVNKSSDIGGQPSI